MRDRPSDTDRLTQSFLRSAENSGEVPNLFATEERISIQEVRKTDRQTQTDRGLLPPQLRRSPLSLCSQCLVGHERIERDKVRKEDRHTDRQTNKQTDRQPIEQPKKWMQHIATTSF